MNLYSLDMKYVRSLHNADDRVQSVSPQIHKNNRPFVGIIVVCEEQKYCVPLDSAKEKHKTQKNDVDFTRIFDGERLIVSLSKGKNYKTVLDLGKNSKSFEYFPDINSVALSPKPNIASAIIAHTAACVYCCYWQFLD